MNSNFEYKIEEIARKNIEKFYPADWDENSITHNLLINLRDKIKSEYFHTHLKFRRINFEAYKLTGKRETDFGDIGLLFRFIDKSHNIIEGAGFIECKKRELTSNKLASIRLEQFTRLLERSPFTKLMIYDYSPVLIRKQRRFFMDYHHFNKSYEDGYYNHSTYCPILPLNFAATFNHFDHTLYPYCDGLAFQFTENWFLLKDLDFRKSAIEAVKGYSEKFSSPKYVMVIHIFDSDESLSHLKEEFGMNLNRNVYSQLGEKQ